MPTTSCAKGSDCTSSKLSIWLAALHRAYGRVAVKSSSVNGNNGQAQSLESLASVKSVAQALEPIIHEQTRTAERANARKKGRGDAVPKGPGVCSRPPAYSCRMFGCSRLPFLLLYVAAERERAVDATSRIVAIMNRLPDSVRLNMTGNIQFSPAADGKPAKAGPELRRETEACDRGSNTSPKRCQSFSLHDHQPFIGFR